MTEQELDSVFTLWQNLKDSDDLYLIEECAKLAKKYDFEVEELPDNLCDHVKHELRRLEHEQYIIDTYF